MGRRGEISSHRIFVDDGRKTYFFNIKENRHHDLYLNIVASRKSYEGFKRSSIVVFEENLMDFSDLLDDAVNAIRQNNPIQLSFLTSNGRREYTMENSQRGRPALKIKEERKEEFGRGYWESIYIELDHLDLFYDGFKKCLDEMNK